MNKLITKILIWHAVVAVLVWRLFALTAHLKFNQATGLEINLPSFGWFLWTTAIIGLGFALFSQVQQRRIFPLTITAIITLFFFIDFGMSWLNLIAAVLFWICLVWAQERLMSEITERLKVNIPRILVVALYPIVVGFFVIASFAAYQSNFADQIKQSRQLPSQTEVLISGVADKVFGSQIGPANSPQRKSIINEAAAQTYQSINDFFRPYFEWAPPVLAFGLFIILWGLSWIFVYAGMFGAWLIFWILKKASVVRIETKQVEAETLVI